MPPRAAQNAKDLAGTSNRIGVDPGGQGGFRHVAQERTIRSEINIVRSTEALRTTNYP